LSARLAARPETRGRNTAELNILTSKELSRTLACKCQSVVSVAADARVRLGDVPVPTLPVLTLSGQEYRPYTRRRRPTYICAKSTSGLNECSNRSTRTAALRPPHMEIGSSPAFGYCARPWRLIPPHRCRLLAVAGLMDQCAAAVPNALMKHLRVLPAHKSRGRPSRAVWQSRRRQEMLA